MNSVVQHGLIWFNILRTRFKFQPGSGILGHTWEVVHFTTTESDFASEFAWIVPASWASEATVTQGFKPCKGKCRRVKHCRRILKHGHFPSSPESWIYFMSLHRHLWTSLNKFELQMCSLCNDWVPVDTSRRPAAFMVVPVSTRSTTAWGMQQSPGFHHENLLLTSHHLKRSENPNCKKLLKPHLGNPPENGLI